MTTTTMVPNVKRDVLDAFNKCRFSEEEFTYWKARFRNVGTPMSRSVLIKVMIQQQSNA